MLRVLFLLQPPFSSYCEGGPRSLKYIERRDRARIYAEILGNIRSALQNGEKPTITRIQITVNVPFVRFKEYWDDMKVRELITEESEVSLTKQGERYLEEYQKVREFLEEFGFIKGNDID